MFSSPLRMLRRLSAISALAFALVLTGCADGKIIIQPAGSTDEVVVRVEVADTPAEREKGLMGRSELPEDSGMLFALPEPEIMTFWMKNTPVPLELLFFDVEGGFVNALSMEPCEEDPCTTYSSAALAQYALEVAPGFRERHGIGVGAKLDLASVARNANPR